MSKLLDPTSRDDMIQFANSAWDSFDWEMTIAIPNQREGKDGPMNESQAKLDDWMEIAGRELYEEVVPPEHVILPRAEVEALRTRCERLRRLVVAERRYRDANTGYPGTASGAEVSAAAREWVATRDSLDPGDLADDVRDPQETTLV